jgi:hypothetical protein
MARAAAVVLLVWMAALSWGVVGLEPAPARTRCCSRDLALCGRARGNARLHALRLRGGSDGVALEYEREEQDKDLRMLARILRRAADKGDLYALRRALQLGAQVNQVDCSGFTALHLAAEKGHEDVVNELLLQVSCRQILCAAVWFAHAHLLTVRVQGASVDPREHISGWTPLHAAAYAARSNVLPILVNHGADVECRDHAGKQTAWCFPPAHDSTTCKVVRGMSFA